MHRSCWWWLVLLLPLSDVGRTDTTTCCKREVVPRVPWVALSNHQTAGAPWDAAQLQLCADADYCTLHIQIWMSWIFLPCEYLNQRTGTLPLWTGGRIYKKMTICQKAAGISVLSWISSLTWWTQVFKLWQFLLRWGLNEKSQMEKYWKITVYI